MRKIHYNKLIRDLIPETITAQGGTYKTRKLGSKEFERELLKKLNEESLEVIAAKTKEEITKEIADVLIVIEELQSIKKISNKELLKGLNENLKRKGGFSKRLFLLWASDTGYKRK